MEKFFNIKIAGCNITARLYKFGDRTPHLELRSNDNKPAFFSTTGYRSHFPGLSDTDEEANDFIKNMTESTMIQWIQRLYPEYKTYSKQYKLF